MLCTALCRPAIGVGRLSLQAGAGRGKVGQLKLKKKIWECPLQVGAGWGTVGQLKLKQKQTKICECLLHSVEFEGFVPPEFWGIRDQICTTQGPEVNCVMQVDL